MSTPFSGPINQQRRLFISEDFEGKQKRMEQRMESAHVVKRKHQHQQQKQQQRLTKAESKKSIASTSSESAMTISLMEQDGAPPLTSSSSEDEDETEESVITGPMLMEAPPTPPRSPSRYLKYRSKLALHSTPERPLPAGAHENEKEALQDQAAPAAATSSTTSEEDEGEEADSEDGPADGPQQEATEPAATTPDRPDGSQSAPPTTPQQSPYLRYRTGMAQQLTTPTPQSPSRQIPQAQRQDEDDQEILEPTEETQQENDPMETGDAEEQAQDEELVLSSRQMAAEYLKRHGDDYDSPNNESHSNVSELSESHNNTSISTTSGEDIDLEGQLFSHLSKNMLGAGAGVVQQQQEQQQQQFHDSAPSVVRDVEGWDLDDSRGQSDKEFAPQEIHLSNDDKNDTSEPALGSMSSNNEPHPDAVGVRFQESAEIKSGVTNDNLLSLNDLEEGSMPAANEAKPHKANVGTQVVSSSSTLTRAKSKQQQQLDHAFWQDDRLRIFWTSLFTALLIGLPLGIGLGVALL